MALPITETLGYKVRLLNTVKMLRIDAEQNRQPGPRAEYDLACVYMKSERRLFLEVQELLRKPNAR